MINFWNFIEKDETGLGVDVNIYDAIEKVYEFTPWELAGVLDVAIGVIGRAKSQGTTVKAKKTIFKQITYTGELF